MYFIHYYLLCQRNTEQTFLGTSSCRRKSSFKFQNPSEYRFYKRFSRKTRPLPTHLQHDGRGEEDLNRLNQEFLERLNRSGKVFLTHTTLRGKYVLRMAIGQRTTEEKHVREAWELMLSTAEEILK